MKIVHLSYNYVSEYNDPETWLRRINFSIGVLEGMARYAEIIGIYHIRYKGILNKNGVLYHFPGYNRWQLLLPFQFNQYVKKLLPDIVIVHGLIFPWQVIMLRWQVGRHIKIIAQHHAEPPLRDVRQYFQRWADHYIKAYLFCSFDLGMAWVDRKQIRDSKKIKEVMEASSHFWPMQMAEARAVTKNLGERIYLWVGRLDHNKDPITLLRAFIRYAKSNPKIALYLVFQDQQLIAEVKELSSKSKLVGQIILVGKVNHDDLLYWYNSADFIISSSHYEGSGIAVCEAMSCGCIPILTNIPSFRMMTDNGRIGLLYEAGNEEALLAALQKSLTLTQEVEKKKVLEWFRSELSFDASARKIMEVIHEIE